MTTTTGASGPPAAPPPQPPPAPPADLYPSVLEGPFTPERPRASWWLRVLAVLLDSAVVATVVWFAAGGSPGLATLPMFRTIDPPLSEAASWWLGGTLLALGLLQAYTGMTPGKRVAGIAVVDAGSGRPIGLLGTVLRFLAHFLDAIFMVGYLRAGLHPEGRTFADSLLGTVVVHSTRPLPHPWVAALRRGRDARVPWFRWPHFVTGAVATVVCAAAAAACLVQGSEGGYGAADTASCRSTGPVEATAIVEASNQTRTESRLGVSRWTTQTWAVSAGWTMDASLPDDGVVPDGAATYLTVRSPDGESYSTTKDGDIVGDEVWLSSTVPEQVDQTVGLDVPEDVSGWTAQVTLVDEWSGTGLLAECSVVLPEIPIPASF
jgi:Mce-associated membrane protein